MLKNYSKIKVDEYGNKYYLNDEGKIHRLDEAAFEWSNGSKEWYINGNGHRNIGPSDEYSDKEKYWYLKGEKHRIGGPYYTSHREYWFIDGKEYTKQEYYKKIWDI